MPSNKPRFKPGKNTSIKIPTNKVGAWLTNVGKSIGYSAQDVLSDVMPATASHVTSAVETVQDFREKMREVRISGKRMQEMAEANVYYQLGQEAIKNAKDAIKTGKFYDKSKVNDLYDDGFSSDDLDMGDFGDFEFDDSFDLDMSDGEAGDTSVVDDGSGNVNVTNIKVNMDIGENSPLVQSVNAQTRISIDTAERAEKLSKVNNTAIMGQLNGLTNQLNGALGAMNENIATVSTVMSTTVTQHASLSAKYYNDSMEIFNKINDQLGVISESYRKPETKQPKDYVDALDLFGANGTLDLGAYGETVKKQFRKSVEGNLFLSSIANMMTQTDEIKAMLQNPLAFIPNKIVSAVFTKTIQDSARAFDETLSETLIAGLHRIRSLSTSDNPIFKFIGETFGIGNKIEGDPDKSAYNRGKVDWDGESRKTLNEVIPYYLRKITAALTGTNEIAFDYNEGKFRTVKDMTDDYENDKRRKLTSELRDVSNDFNEFITKEITFRDSKSKQDASDFADKFIEKLVRSPGNPLYRDDNNSFLKSIAEMMSNGNIEDSSAQLLSAWLDGQANSYVMSLSRKALESQRNYSQYMRDIESGRVQSNYMYMNNGTTYDDIMKKDPTGTITDKVDYSKSIIGGARDKYGKTSVEYLRDILTTLVTGIKVYNVGGANVSDANNTIANDILTNSTKVLDSLKTSSAVSDADERRVFGVANPLTSETAIARASENHTLVDSDTVNRNVITERARDFRIAQNDSEDNNSIDWFLRMTGLREDDPLSKMINKISRVVTQKPTETISGIFKTADDFLFKIVFGGGNNNIPMVTRATAYLKGHIKGAFSKFAQVLNNDVFVPLRNALFGEDGKSGLIGQIKNSKFGVDIKNAAGKAREYLFGVKDETGKYTGGLFSEVATELSSIATNVKTSVIGDGPDSILSNIKVTIADKVDSALSMVGLSKTGSGKPRSETPIQDALDNARGMIVERSRRFLDDILGDNTERAQYLSDIQSDLTGKRGKLGAGAALGFIGSFFLPGGPILGALLGIGTTAVKESQTLQDILFGYTDEYGTDRAGLIKKDIVDLYNNNKTGIKVGITAAMLSKFGILGGLMIPGGPIGGALLGLGASLAYKSDTFQEFLFGPDDGSGNRIGGGAIDKIKDTFSKLGITRDNFVDAGLGAGVGFLGGFLLPTGPIGGALLGAGLGFASSMDVFKTYLFGEKRYDAEGNSLGREGGLFGKALNKFADMFDRAINFVETSITIPLTNAAKPILYSTFELLKGMGRFATNIIIGKKDKNGNYVGGIVGTAMSIILGNRDDDGKIKGGILSPLVRAVGTVSRGLVKGASYIATMPVRMIERFGIMLDMKNRFDKMVEPFTNALAKLGEGLTSLVVDHLFNPIKHAIVDPITKGIKELLKFSYKMTFGLAGKLIKGILNIGTNTVLAPFRLLGAATTMIPGAITGKAHAQDKAFLADTFGQMITGRDSRGIKGSRIRGFLDFFTNSEARKKWESTGRMSKGQSLVYHDKDSRSGLYMTTKQSIDAGRASSDAWMNYKIGVRNGTIDPRTGKPTSTPPINPDTGKPYTRADLVPYLRDKNKFLDENGYYNKNKPKGDDPARGRRRRRPDATADDTPSNISDTIRDTSFDTNDNIRESADDVVASVNDSTNDIVAAINRVIDVIDGGANDQPVDQTRISVPDIDSGGDISDNQQSRRRIRLMGVRRRRPVANTDNNPSEIAVPDAPVDDNSGSSGGFIDFLKSIHLFKNHKERSGFIFGENSVLSGYKDYRNANIAGDTEKANVSVANMKERLGNTLLGRIAKGMFGDSIFGQNPDIEKRSVWKRHGIFGGLYRKIFGDSEAEENTKERRGIVGTITKGITDFFNETIIGKVLKTIFSVMLGGALLGHGAKLFTEYLSPALGKAADWVTGTAFPWLKNVFGGIGTAIDSTLTGVFGDSWVAFKDKVSDFTDSIINPKPDSFLGKVKSFFTTFIDAVHGEYGSDKDGGLGAWAFDKIMKPAANFIVSGWKNLWDYVGEPLLGGLKSMLYEWWQNKDDPTARNAAIKQGMDKSGNTISNDSLVTFTVKNSDGTTHTQTASGELYNMYLKSGTYKSENITIDNVENGTAVRGMSSNLSALYNNSSFIEKTSFFTGKSKDKYIIFYYKSYIIYITTHTSALEYWLGRNLPNLKINNYHRPNPNAKTTYTGWFVGTGDDVADIYNNNVSSTNSAYTASGLADAIIKINSADPSKAASFSNYVNPDDVNDLGYMAYKILRNIWFEGGSISRFKQILSDAEIDAIGAAIDKNNTINSDMSNETVQGAVDKLDDLVTTKPSTSVNTPIMTNPAIAKPTLSDTRFNVFSGITDRVNDFGGNGGTLNNFPYYSQNDDSVRGKSYKYSNSDGVSSTDEQTMGKRGCGPTAMAMVNQAVTGDKSGPMKMAKLAEEQGYSDASGTRPNYFTNVGRQLGMEVTEATATPANIYSLVGTEPIIIQGRSTKPDSPYTSSGHYVVAVGKDNSGNIIVNDPRGRKYSGKYTMGQIMDGSAKMWGFRTSNMLGGNGTVNKNASAEEQIAALLATAQKYVGYLEKASAANLDNPYADPGNNNYSYFVREYSKYMGITYNTAEWCAMFVSVVFVETFGLEQAKELLCGNLFASCSAQMNKFKSKGRFVTQNPQPGDIAFFDWTGDKKIASHVGIVKSVEGDYVITIEGNTRGGTSSKYDGVFEARRSLKLITGFGRPAYNGATVLKSDTTANRSTFSILSKMSDFVSTVTGAMMDSLFGNVGGTDLESSQTTLNLTGYTDKQKIWNYLRNKGYSEAATAGIMGNLGIESGLRSDNVEDSYESRVGDDAAYTRKVDNGEYSRDQFSKDSAGYGLAQWTYHSRKAGLYDLVKKNNTSIADLGTQLDYLDSEAQNSMYGYKNINNVRQASNRWMLEFERPYDQSKAAQNTRANYSQTLYDELAGNGDGSDHMIRYHKRYDTDFKSIVDKDSKFAGNGAILNNDDVVNVLNSILTEVQGTNIGINKFNDKELKVETRPVIVADNSTTNNVVAGNNNKTTAVPSHTVKNNSFVTPDKYSLAKRIAAGSFG